VAIALGQPLAEVVTQLQLRGEATHVPSRYSPNAGQPVGWVAAPRPDPELLPTVAAVVEQNGVKVHVTLPRGGKRRACGKSRSHVRGPFEPRAGERCFRAS
jgi:hypothetical protein